MTEQKITHEIKVSKPIMTFLWVMGIGLKFRISLSHPQQIHSSKPVIHPLQESLSLKWGVGGRWGVAGPEVLAG